MLQVTQGAVAALKEMRSNSDIPDNADVRIQIVASEGREGIGLTFIDRPLEGDQVVAEQEDLKVMVAGELAPALDASILDARSTDSGIQLELRDQAPGSNSESPAQ